VAAFYHRHLARHRGNDDHGGGGGCAPQSDLQPFESAWTMTGYIASISGGDLGYDTLDYNSIFVVGLVVVHDDAGLNILSRIFG